jgi:hypothetical protein
MLAQFRFHVKRMNTFRWYGYMSKAAFQYVCMSVDMFTSNQTSHSPSSQTSTQYHLSEAAA